MTPAPQPGIAKARRAVQSARRSLEVGDADFAALPERHGLAFRTAFDRRSIGDYDYVVDFPAEVAQAVIDDATAFIDDAEAYLARFQNPPKP